MSKKSIDHLLFEIGVEEIPSGYFQQAEKSIFEKAPALLMECGWQFDRLNIFTTPRRFVIYAENFRQVKIQEEEKLGPQKEQAYQNGKAMPALIGFLKSVNRQESDLYFKPSAKGERVAVKIKKAAKPLTYFFETLPQKIEFPKLMRWNKNNDLFTRPIRWTFAYVGNRLQKYTLAGVRSGTHTYGHRFLSPQKIKVSTANLELFEKLLYKHHVVLDPKKRLEKIEYFLNEPSKNRELMNTINHLVEEPFPVRGTFRNNYLKLPATVLKTCMSKNQKIFALYDTKGKLTNHFLAVINGPRKKTVQIAKNYESVLTSRLEDAEFFFREDQKTKLEAKVPQLKEMIFLGSLGSYLDKTKRVQNLIQALGKETGLPEEMISRARRAAYLSKADLVTHLVYEFPELQGFAGEEYARLNGEEELVAKAISGHYLPQNLFEDYTQLKKQLCLEGALVGIADRLDLLVGAVSLGVTLSGSQDPYALRRAAGGIVKIVRAHQLNFSLRRLIQASVEEYGKLISKTKEEIIQQLIPFFRDRIIFELQLKSGSKPYELLESILSSPLDRLVDVYEKFDQLNQLLNHDSLIRACKVMERTGNILKGIKEKLPEQVDAAVLADPLEKKLFDLFCQKEPAIRGLIQAKKYGDAAQLYGDTFGQPVHDFFDQVMVNVEDLKIRSNRQILVRKINRLCFEIADLSLVKQTS